MKPRTQNLIGCSVLALVIFIGIVGYGAYKIYSFFNEIGLNKEVPAELKEAKVTVGADFLQKTEYQNLIHLA